MGNLERQDLEAIPMELLRAKERLRFHSQKFPYVDVEGEGDPPDPLPDLDQPRAEGATLSSQNTKWSSNASRIP